MSHPDDGVLQELLDGELAPADEAVVRAHIAGCAPCTTALAELKAIQLEADSIVTRLDLDPPLRRPASRAHPGARRVNFRMLGLAASAVLVAGTSWVLLRSSPQDYKLSGGADTGSGVILPMPSEERQEGPVTPPAAPPAPSAGARDDASADQRAKAQQAPREADAPAGPSAAKEVASQAEQRPGMAAAKMEAADESSRANEARRSNAPAPMARTVPPAAVARLTADATKPSEWRLTTVADAEAQLGTRLRTISGLTPVSVEMLPLAADSLLAVRQHYIVSGVPVVLVQQGSTAVPYTDDVNIQPGNRGGHGFVASGGAAALESRTWEAWGSLFQLRGALPADSIDALMKRVR